MGRGPGGSPSLANVAASGPAADRMAPNEERNWLDMWIPTRTAAGRSDGSAPASRRNASTPPADVPIARMSWLRTSRSIVTLAGAPDLVRDRPGVAVDLDVVHGVAVLQGVEAVADHAAAMEIELRAGAGQD